MIQTIIWSLIPANVHHFLIKPILKRMQAREQLTPWFSQLVAWQRLLSDSTAVGSLYFSQTDFPWSLIGRYRLERSQPCSVSESSIILWWSHIRLETHQWEFLQQPLAWLESQNRGPSSPSSAQLWFEPLFGYRSIYMRTPVGKRFRLLSPAPC